VRVSSVLAYHPGPSQRRPHANAESSSAVVPVRSPQCRIFKPVGTKQFFLDPGRVMYTMTRLCPRRTQALHSTAANSAAPPLPPASAFSRIFTSTCHRPPWIAANQHTGISDHDRKVVAVVPIRGFRFLHGTRPASASRRRLSARHRSAGNIPPSQADPQHRPTDSHDTPHRVNRIRPVNAQSSCFEYPSSSSGDFEYPFSIARRNLVLRCLDQFPQCGLFPRIVELPAAPPARF